MQAIKSARFLDLISETSKKSTNQNIVLHFLNQAQKLPNQTAIIEKNRAITFSDLKNEVDETAGYFLERGLKKGDRVLVFVPVSIDLYKTVLALFQIGAVAVFLDEWSSKDRLKKACEIADCTGFVAGWKGRILGAFLSPVRKIPIWLSPKRKPQNHSKNMVQNVNSENPALITFTTGSTGIPKAANRTHGFLNAQMNALVEKIQPKSGEVEMPALPIFVLLNLGSGVTSILPDFNPRKPEKLNPKTIISQLQTHNVERLIASPFFLKKLASHLKSEKIELPFLKKIYTGGAPVFPDEAKLFVENFGEKTSIEIVYGSTEAEPISNISSSVLAKAEIKKGLPVGKIFHRTDLKIIAATEAALEGFEIEDLELPVGEIGEIIVAGDHVLKDYFRNPQAIRENKIFDKNRVWHRTGDAGFLAKNGELFLVGRCKQLIHSEGKLLTPFLAEYQLGEISGVVIGTILKLENKLVAVIESEENFNQNEISIRIKAIFQTENMVIKFVKKMPRDQRHLTKIDYEKLKSF